MSQANKKVRDVFRETKVPFWCVADVLGKSDYSFSRMLRHELPEEKQEEIISIIRKIDAGEMSGLYQEKQKKVELPSGTERKSIASWGIVQVRDDLFRCNQVSFMPCYVDSDEALAIAFGYCRLRLHIPMKPLRDLLCSVEE